MKVVMFTRKSFASSFSIENVFSDMLVSEDVEYVPYVCRWYSKGIVKRFFNMIHAALHQGDVNHITGDIHYLNYFMCKKKTLLTIHDCSLLKKNTRILFYLYWFFWYFLPISRSGYVTVVSNFTKKELVGYMGEIDAPLKVVHDCVSEMFSYHPKPFNCLNPRILQVGTKKNKNLERVIEALSDIPCVFVVIGVLSEKQKELLNYYKINYENYYHLTRAELLAQYILSDMLVFVSLYEGFGLPIVEANAVGRPVITSDLCSMPEVANNAACLVDPYDVNDIKKCVKFIVDNQEIREALISKGLLNAERFRPHKIADKYYDIYQSMK